MAKAELYHSNTLENLLNQISPIELKIAEMNMQIAANIMDLLPQRGITKEELAQKMDLDLDDIYYILSGTFDFNVEILIRICHILDVKVKDLLNFA